MAKKKGFGSVKRFGARYGRSLKHKLAAIEQVLRKKQLCPYCHNKTVKRLAVGIWYCKKCKSKFTGKAYSIEKKIVFKEEEPAEEIQKEVTE